MMGIEYRITFPPKALPEMEEYLRRFGGVPRKDEPGRMEFRFRPDKSGGLPEASVVFEANALIFCDHSGDRGPVGILLHKIIDKALEFSATGQVVISSP